MTQFKRVVRGPSTFINLLNEEALGVPARWVVHHDIDRSLLAEHELARWACLQCEYCVGFLVSSDHVDVDLP